MIPLNITGLLNGSQYELNNILAKEIAEDMFYSMKMLFNNTFITIMCLAIVVIILLEIKPKVAKLFNKKYPDGVYILPERIKKRKLYTGERYMDLLVWVLTSLIVYECVKALLMKVVIA